MAAAADLGDRQIFEAIAEKISKITGVQLGEKQYSLVLSRLSKHLRNMGGMTPSEYWEYLKHHEKQEVPVLISLLTTHHTFFFREQVHFDYLNSVLAELVEKVKRQNKTFINIWCAACSKGQEGYTLAMFFDYHLKQLGAEIKYRILFSDVDSASVHWSKNGVYTNDELNRVPITYRSNHWIRGQKDVAQFSKVRDTLKQNCEFRTINLLHINDEKFSEKFDLVFCRNVFIYFTVQEIEKISKNILNNMEDYGYFFIGVSESLHEAKLDINHLGKSIYQKSEPIATSDSKENTVDPKTTPVKKETTKDKGNVLNMSQRISKRIEEKEREKAKAVSEGKRTHKSTATNISDDNIKKVITLQSSLNISPNIRSIINDIPGFKSVGFDVISSAKQAIERIKAKRADILLMDCNSNQFLAQIKRSSPIPIILIGTSKEDEAKLAKSMELGATDFLKGSFAKITEREKDILALKLSQVVKKVSETAHLLKAEVHTLPSQKLDENYIIAIGASTGGTEAISKVMEKLPANTPPIVIVQHIPPVYSRSFAERLSSISEINVKEAEDGDVLKQGCAYVAPGDFHMEVIKVGGIYKTKVYSDEKVSGHRPSVDVLFNSLTAIHKPIIAVLMTGMGSDGAKGLLKLHEKGVHTITQDEKSCVVYGMPKAAVKLGASKKSLHLDKIADELLQVLKK